MRGAHDNCSHGSKCLYGLETGVDADGTDTGRRIGRRVVLRRCSNGQEKRNEHVDEGHAEESQDRQAMKAKDKAKLNPDLNLTLADIQNLEDAQQTVTKRPTRKCSRSSRRASRPVVRPPNCTKTRDWRTRPLPKPPRPISWKPSCRRPPATRTTPKPSPTPWAEVNPAGPKDMGRVVKAARAALAGKTIDGGKLAGLVKAELNQ